MATSITNSSSHDSIEWKRVGRNTTCVTRLIENNDNALESWEDYYR